MIPYKEWMDFDIVTLEGHDTVNNAFDDPIDWTNIHYGYGIVGTYTQGATNWWRWFTLIRPKGSDFILDIPGRDFPVSAVIDYKATSTPLYWHPAGITQLSLNTNTLFENITEHIWDADKATGRYIDGVAEEWDNYPIWTGHWFCDTIGCPGLFAGTDIDRTDVIGSPTPPPHQIQVELAARFAGGENMWSGREYFFRNGMCLRVSAWAGVVNYNKAAFFVSPERCKIKYFNPVVNSFSRYRISPAGGDTLVINGLGFDNSDADINEFCSCWTTPCLPGSTWTDDVDKIEFWTTDGVLIATITSGLGEFTLNSNSQITIASMPALAEGTYYVNLIKQTVGTNIGALGSATGYAGDWRTDSYGRMSEGSRFELLVADEEEEEDEPPNPRTRWRWGEHDGEVFAYYSYLDTRGRDTFWEGRIKNMSPLTRMIDDRTGLFGVSDVSVTLANNDMEMSKMLSRYFLRNKLVDFYYGWGRQAEAWDEYFFQGVVIDYDLIGTHFDVMVQDVTQKYFGMDTAQHICTLEEYPFIHESAIGKSMPDALGLCELIPATADENSGAIEARYVDTRAGFYSYLAAQFSLTGITEVYSNNVEIFTPADYTVAYRDGGRTYIDCTANQGDNKITYNCVGYSVGIWDDPTNGYIQNPAYVISFYLTQIVGMPLALLDMESFDDLAALYTTNNWHQSAKLILQDGRDAMEVLRELLYSFGANLWIAKDGRLTIGRKDITNFATDLVIFQQIHAFEHAKREYNLQDFVNAANVQWDYIPTHSTFKYAEEISSPRSIEDYGKERYPSTPWHFPWLVSEISSGGAGLGLVEQRMREELLKYDFGYKKISFKVPIQMIDDLDIFTNFRYQDPFGLSWTKEGEKGRYYYISSLTYDFQDRSIEVVGIDLQYLIGQYLIIGDCDALSSDWTTGSEHNRIYAAVSDCDTGRFSNGDPGKVVGPCDTV